ncbi:MAG TPA: phospho-N-acetylmuramoyl-pentapeptide-transferase [Desulfobacteria bacterium]|nr:phospho-N-acetylmuramoyl-pentapeptide-transferase [Desulfobacteria bacterium]
MDGVIYAFLAALICALLIGPILIPMLFNLKFGQYIRSDGPERHLKKAGTPTMGGVMFLAGSAVGTLLFAPKTGTVFLVLGTTLAFGIIGFIDDYIKVVLKRSLGLRALQKIAGQFGAAIIASVIAVNLLGRGTDLVVPFIGYIIDPGPVLYLVFSTFIIVGTANAVNLTDGLDGLAAGCMALSAGAFVIIALMMDKPVTGAAFFAASLAGGCVGFLRFNAHPAKVFMGDTGSLALGGALAILAVVTKTELFLPFLGVIYVAETLSVIIQVISFKFTGKRVFRMSPLHHHFELGGWSEKKVVRVFWLVSLTGAMLAILGLRNLG